MNGLFIGLTTLDIIYLTAKFPESNEKIVAIDQTIAAGGPATNAAVTFNHLGNQANLIGIIGNHPLSQLIRSELETYSINIVDLDPHSPQSPPTSSIIVTQSTGERAVISINATKIQATADQIPPDILQGVEVILIDGHQIAVSQVIAQQAKAKNIPVIIDGGSWKPGCEKVLPFVDYAICSSNFYPPNCHNREDIFAYLQAASIRHIAITQGENPIHYLNNGKTGTIEVPATQVVDTLGAGDVFHGAFCHYILQENFIESLTAAAQVASNSCRFFGTRQ